MCKKVQELHLIPGKMSGIFIVYFPVKKAINYYQLRLILLLLSKQVTGSLADFHERTVKSQKKLLWKKPRCSKKQKVGISDVVCQYGMIQCSGTTFSAHPFVPECYLPHLFFLFSLLSIFFPSFFSSQNSVVLTFLILSVVLSKQMYIEHNTIYFF